MKIAVIGATGMTGFALLNELLERGHNVTGISRSPDKLGVRAGLRTAAADIMNIDQLAEAIKGHDAVACAHSAGHGQSVQVYKDMVEAGWKLRRAFMQADGQYFLHVGGAGSLYVAPGIQLFDDPRWPRWYFDTASVEHLRYLVGLGLTFFRPIADARERSLVPPYPPIPDGIEAQYKLILEGIASNHNIGEGNRAQFEMLRNDFTFRWSFVSPPWFYRTGDRTGQYRFVVDDLPMDGDKPAGITVPDLAAAMADVLETQNYVHQHWSAAGPV